MGLTLELKRALEVPLDMSLVTPGSLLGKPIETVGALHLWMGNRKKRLDELFKVEENREDSITLLGDLSKARRIGFNMESGLITVKGDSGLNLGEGMSGGNIKVEGNADAWLGSRMSSGEIVVEGDAGDFVGSSYRGSREGMKGGHIVVKGNAGDEVGCWMRGGTIRIEGDVGCFPGIHMIDGAVVVGGDCSGRAGAQMTGGKVIVLGKVPSVLSSFQTSDVKKKVKVEGEPIDGPFYLFEGDVNEGGSGKLYIGKARNPHIGWCEALIGEVD